MQFSPTATVPSHSLAISFYRSPANVKGGCNQHEKSNSSQAGTHDCHLCGTFAQCWDVRLDPSTNEVYRKELASLGMGESTPEEFCENMDKAVEQYASDYFDTEE